MLRWLHISDLHFNSDDMSTSALREELLTFLKRNIMVCDYVFCTGDIRTANARPNHFTDEAAKYLVDICQAVGVDSDRLFIVPGNHDVDREVAGRDETIRRICFQRKGSYDPKYGTITEEDLRAIHAGQSEFRDFLSKVYPANPDRVAKYSNPLAPHFNIETRDFNILHIDSTLTYTKDQEAVDLILGTKLLQNALFTLNQRKPTILLSHYPFTALLQEEKKYIRELLYRKGVRLWLAGHEHDHMVHPVDYFDSLQAGELRMEERTNATVLIGEYDEATNTGHVVAYTWFPEGWAKYPILWHDGRREDQYSFQLRLPGDNGLSREVVKAKQANREFLDRIVIIDELIPAIDGRGSADLNSLLDSMWSSDTPHMILLADGGMGKTTMLLKLCRDSDAVMLYIPAERLEAIGSSIRNYCSRVLFAGDLSAFENFTAIKYTKPTLTLLVDGLNEVNSKVERQFIKEIRGLDLLPGIQIVVTSRSDFTARYSMSGYRVGRLKPLSDEQIETVFSSDEWADIKDTVTLRRLLSNPMMVTMYKAISPIIKQYEAEESLQWILPIKSATDLLQNYYVAQIAVLLHRSGVDGQKAQLAYQAIFDVLPAIAYEYESTHSLNKSNPDFRTVLEAVLQSHEPDDNALLPLQERFRDYDVPAMRVGSVLDYLTEETHLLYKDKTVTAFPHQIYRDFLSASWIVRQTDIERYWNTRGLQFPVMEHIRNLSGKYWEGLAKQVHEAGKNRTDAFHLIGNLLDCFPYTENSGCPDYSELDLRGLQIPGAQKAQSGFISLNGARIDKVSIGKSSSRLVQYTHLRLSEGNEFLAAVSNGKVLVFPLQAEEEPFIYSIGGGISRLSFVGSYLFASVDGLNASVQVFKRDTEWSYVGELKNPDETHCSLFNNRFRMVILKDDVLYFYYNNREVRFSLTDCSRIYNHQKQHAWETPVQGVDVSFLKEKDRQHRNRNNGTLWRTENSGLKAVSTIDGGLTITSGVEIQHVLSRGITLLKDGAISGDGKCAATLSYDLEDDRRKTQIWDLDKKVRIGEMLCPGSIEKIHMSEDGTFVIGETGSDSWVFNRKTRTEKWYSGHFISNQHGKISTYGTKVLRKNKDNDLYLYDLESGEVHETGNPCKNARLACFMSDGSIAVVGNNARKVKFKNIRTGRYSEVNSQNSPVIGISSFKNEPFIAVATQDNIISIYHIGDCMRKKIFDKTGGNYLMVVSPENTVIACSNGQKSLQTFNYYEKVVKGKKMGWWYPNPYSKEDPAIKGDVLDLSFNTENQELVVILSNGQIMFCHEKYCRYHGATDIITNFNVTAYDFRGCICDQTIKEQIRQNGGLIESAVEEELATAQGIMDENPVLAHSPGDIRRAGQTVEQYLSGFSEEEHVKYKEYYKDELP